MKFTLTLNDISFLTASELASVLRDVAKRIQDNGTDALRACPQTRDVLSHGRGTTLHSLGQWSTEDLPPSFTAPSKSRWYCPECGQHYRVHDNRGCSMAFQVFNTSGNDSDIEWFPAVEVKG